MTRHILLAEIMHESNTFNHIATTKIDFESRYWLTGNEIPERLKDTNTEIWGVLEQASAWGWRVTHPFAASASPSGPMAADDWHEVKQQILSPLKAGESFDAVFLVLHGAMVTKTSLDPEGDLLEEVRALVGPDMPIVVTLDMHANVSQRMVAHSTLMMAYRTYPHVDQYERAQHVVSLLKRILDEGLNVTQHFARKPMMDAADHGQTGKKPMQKLLAVADEIEKRPGILCASVQIGFPWADVAEIGPSVLVAGLEDHSGLCKLAADELLDAVWESRNETQLDFATPDEAMVKARVGTDNDKPLILADFADNPAGGAYGDSPNLLRTMLESGLQNAAFATICDPQSVALTIKAGVGNKVRLSLGGKHVPDLTPPLGIEAKVLRITNGNYVCDGPMWQGVAFSMGPTTVLRCGDIDVIVSSVPVAVMDLQVFISSGIDPRTKTAIGLKSRNHFKAAYTPIARDTLLVDAGGIASMKLASLPYKNIPRPIWPLDEKLR
ncbi:MAG: M81 family metallopeptidase [Hyphomicrobiales bacterium]